MRHIQRFFSVDQDFQDQPTPKDADKAEYQRLQPELLKLIEAQNRRNAGGKR